MLAQYESHKQIHIFLSGNDSGEENPESEEDVESVAHEEQDEGMA